MSTSCRVTSATTRRRTVDRAADADRAALSLDVTRLANGLRVVTDSIEGVGSAAVGVWVNVGARDEPDHLHGISHLLEHMAFKGTERRSARMIAQEIEDVGGYVNAYTTRENTAYYARVLGDDVPLAIDVLGDILQNSVFDECELEKERWVVEQEIAQVFDTPDDLVFDLFQECAFPDQPMGRSILGTPASIAGMTRQTLLGHMTGHYTAESMVLSAAGAVDHGEIVRLAEEQFCDLPRSNGHLPRPAAYAGGAIDRKDDVEQVHLVMGCPGFGICDDNYYPVQFFSNALGGGMSSRLFQEIREDRGLAYTIYSFHSAFEGSGLFGIYAGCAEADAREVANLVVDAIARTADGLADDEIERARTQMKAGLLMARESTAARCEALARQMLVFGRTITEEEIIGKIEAVCAEDIRECAETLFQGTRPAMACIGPEEGIVPYRTILSGLGKETGTCSPS